MTQALLQNRFQMLRGMLINSGVPAANVNIGTLTYSVPIPQLPNGANQTTFNIQRTTTTRTATPANQPTQIQAF